MDISFNKQRIDFIKIKRSFNVKQIIWKKKENNYHHLKMQIIVKLTLKKEIHRCFQMELFIKENGTKLPT